MKAAVMMAGWRDYATAHGLAQGAASGSYAAFVQRQWATKVEGAVYSKVMGEVSWRVDADGITALLMDHTVDW